jgi:hypothetical protein
MKKTILLLALFLFGILGLQTAFATPTDTLVQHNSTIIKTDDVPQPYHHHMNVNDEVPNIAYVMPIAFFIFILVIIGFSQYFNYKRNKDRMALYLKYLEHGKEVPVNLLVQPKDVSSNLKRGIILIAVGIGVSIFLFADSPGSTDWTLGIIPFLIGAGYLTVYKISPKPPAATGSND